jgi:hypothetical protein
VSVVFVSVPELIASVCEMNVVLTHDFKF